MFSSAGDRRLRPVRLSAVAIGAEHYYLVPFNTIYLRQNINLTRNFLITVTCVFDAIPFILARLIFFLNFDPKFNSKINFYDVHIASLKHVK